MQSRVLFILGLVSILPIVGCAEREPLTILFTSDVKGRIRPAG